MFDDNVLYDLNLRYLSAVKELATEDQHLAKIKFGLSELMITIIANCSFQQLEHLANQNVISFNVLPNENEFCQFLAQPNNKLLTLMLKTSNELMASGITQ